MKGLQPLIEKTKKKPALALVLLAIPFLFLYAWFYLTSAGLYNSPDENANAVFLSNYAQQRSFFYPVDEQLPEQVMPRSVQRGGEGFVPTGFLGLPLLYGNLVAVYGFWVLAFLTPMLAVSAVVAFYLLFKEVFEEWVAFLSAVFLLFLPQWWHFTAKGFLPNVAFLSCLLIGLACLVQAHRLEKKSWQLLCGGLAGLFAATALMIRPAEIWWVAFVFVVLIVTYRRTLKVLPIVLFVTSSLAVFLSWLPVQLETYGSLFASGYGTSAVVSGSSAVWGVSFLFPFGVDMRTIAQSVFHFVFRLFWWQSLLIGAGLIYLFKGKALSKEQKVYLLLMAGVSVYLFMLYGSWPIQDDLDANRVSIGVSYVRYWLPVFVGAIPLMVIAMKRLSNQFLGRIAWGFPALFALVLGVHVTYVFAAGDDNLSALSQNIVDYRELRELASQIPSDGIIVSERMDKVFWPEHPVIHLNKTDFTYLDDPVLQEHDLYWFTILPLDHVRIHEEREFLPRGYALEQIFAHDTGSLYHLSPRL